MDKAQAIAALRQIANAVVETVNEQPQGAPAGPMYLAFMAQGMSLNQFEQITGALVAAGRITRRGDCFYPA
jgi:hypothetical protein